MKALLPLVFLPALAMAQIPAGDVKFSHVPPGYSAVQGDAYRKAAVDMNEFILHQGVGGDMFHLIRNAGPTFDGRLAYIRSYLLDFSKMHPVEPKSGQLASADAELDAVYESLMKTMRPDVKVYGPDGSQKELRTAERYWLSYRDAMVAFGKTLSPPLPESAWLLWLTNQRVNHLKAQLKKVEDENANRPVTILGRVVRADNGKPIAGATVIAGACLGCEGIFNQNPANDPVTTTDTDGSFRFPAIPRESIGLIEAALTGYSPGRAGMRCADECIGDTWSSDDIKLTPAAIATQMNDSALDSTYGNERPCVEFRSAAFAPDGNTLQLLAGEDCDSKHYMGWKYNLRTGVLEPGPEIPDEQLRPDGPQKVGSFEVDEEPRGEHTGASSINAWDQKTGIRFRVADFAVSGFVGSSDGSAVIWFDGRALQVFDLKSRRAKHVSLPNSWVNGVWPLAAFPEADGYHVAYDSIGPCNIDGAIFIRKVESDEAEQMILRRDPQAQPTHEPHNVCFASVPAPAR